MKYFSLFVSNYKSAKLRKHDLGIYNQTYLWYNVNRKIFMEVKGCTLEKDGVVLFPDAPTLRGVKHIEELSHCLDEGYESYIMILVQMSDVKYFTPNYDTHPEFGEALEKASRKGVKILCYDCNVTHDSMTVGKPVKVKLGR